MSCASRSSCHGLRRSDCESPKCCAINGERTLPTDSTPSPGTTTKYRTSQVCHRLFEHSPFALIGYRPQSRSVICFTSKRST